MTIAGEITTGVLTVDSDQWYEPFIGLLRARISSVSLTTAGIPLSLPFESQVELRAFTPGQVIQP